MGSCPYYRGQLLESSRCTAPQQRRYFYVTDCTGRG